VNDMKIDRKKSEQIYAYGTNVTVSRSIEEIRGLLRKYGAKGFAHVISPNSEQGAYIAFIIPTKLGDVPVRIVVPSIYLNGRFRELESYRAAVLIIKSKFLEIELGEPAEQVFLGNMASNIRDKLLPHIEIPMLEAGDKP